LLVPSMYMVLLAVGALATPGVGIAGSVLAVVPQPLTDYSHAPAYALLTCLLTGGLRNQGWSKQMALRLGVMAAMVFGVCMELLQGFVPERTVDIHDVAFNALGIGLAVLLLEATPEPRAFTFATTFLRSRK
jgi:VanZ family protein